MCGRFALGYDGDEIVAYFAAQQEPEEAPPQSDEEDSGGEEEEHRAESFEVEEQPVASGSGAGAGAGRRRVHWANEEAKGGYRPRYNVRSLSPSLASAVADPHTQVAPQSRSVVIHKLPGSDEYVLELMVPRRLEQRGAGLTDRVQKWGLVPSWTKRPPEKPLSTFNAREESVASGSGMWAGLRGKHRCVVVAQGRVALQTGELELKIFLRSQVLRMACEGQGEDPALYQAHAAAVDGHGRTLGRSKVRPYSLIPPSHPTDSFRRYEDGSDPFKSFTIITTSSNKQLSFVRPLLTHSSLSLTPFAAPRSHACYPLHSLRHLPLALRRSLVSKDPVPPPPFRRQARMLPRSQGSRQGPERFKRVYQGPCFVVCEGGAES